MTAILPAVAAALIISAFCTHELSWRATSDRLSDVLAIWFPTVTLTVAFSCAVIAASFG